MDKERISQKIRDLLPEITRYIEFLISVIIILVILLQILNLLRDVIKDPFFLENNYFTIFLARALNLVVGIEFVKMLCKHTPETVVEVLMFATARQMVVAHLQTCETLIGILGIGVLFAIRKYLFLSAKESKRLSDKF